jgi:hypothetical protein
MSPAGGGTRAVRTCTATTGFFVLDRCERNARRGCTRCQRSICERHTHALPGTPDAVCPECYAAGRGYISDPNDPMWSVGYRRSFYWEVSSSTGDTTWWSDFDDFDREAFEMSAEDGEWADGELDDGADYLDS